MVRASCVGMVVLCMGVANAQLDMPTKHLMTALHHRNEIIAHQLIDNAWCMDWVNMGDNEGETALFKAIRFDCLTVTERLCQLLNPNFLMHALRLKNRHNCMALHMAAYEASPATLEFVLKQYGHLFATDELLQALKLLFYGYVNRHGFGVYGPIGSLLPRQRVADLKKRAQCKDALGWSLIKREQGGLKTQELLQRWYTHFMVTRIPLPEGLFLNWKL